MTSLANPSRSSGRNPVRPETLATLSPLPLLSACGTDSADGGKDIPSTAAGDRKAPPASKVPDEFENRTAKMAMDPGFGALNSVKEGTTESEGLNVDLAKAVSKEPGIRAELVSASFARTIDAVTSGRYDLSVSAVTGTVERRREVGFVDYVPTRQAFFVPTGNPKKTEGGVKDTCGLEPSITPGTTDEALFKRIFDACKPAGSKRPEAVRVAGVSAAFPAPDPGRAAAVIRENSSRHPGTSEPDHSRTSCPGTDSGTKDTGLRDVFPASRSPADNRGYRRILDRRKQSAGSLSKPGTDLGK